MSIPPKTWTPCDEPLKKFFEDPDPEEMNGFLRKALGLMTQTDISNSSSTRQTAAIVIQFLENVIADPSCYFKLYAILMLVRSDPEIWEMVRQKERVEIADTFMRKLAYEFNLFATGFRPPSLKECQNVSEIKPMEYTKDDPEKMNHHTAEFVVYRMGCFYRLL